MAMQSLRLLNDALDMVANIDLAIAWLANLGSLLIKMILEQWSNDALLDLLCHLVDTDELITAVKDCNGVLFQVYHKEYAMLSTVYSTHEEEHRCLVKVPAMESSEGVIELPLVHDTILAFELFDSLSEWHSKVLSDTSV